jgi:hypothetical protein
MKWCILSGWSSNQEYAITDRHPKQIYQNRIHEDATSCPLQNGGSAAIRNSFFHGITVGTHNRRMPPIAAISPG